jgi:hypothetical protein
MEMIAKDIEPLLEEYTRQIILEVAEMRDPYSVEGMKINVNFKLKEKNT